MKVAVCLRGQPRFSKEGAKLFKKFVVEKHPDVEFEFFAHTWNTLSKRMMTDDAEGKRVDRVIPTWLTNDEVVELTSPWVPKDSLIQGEHECLKIACAILKRNANKESKTFEWLTGYANDRGWKFTDDKLLHHKVLMPSSLTIARDHNIMDVYHHQDLHDAINATIRLEEIKLSYMLAQMISAGKSFKLLQQYMDTNPDYVPDLIISTRYDILTWFYSFPKLLHDIKDLDHGAKLKKVYTRKINIKDQVPIIDDYLLVGTIRGMTGLLSNIDRRLHDALVDNALKNMNIIHSGPHLQHLLWTKIADEDLTISTPSKFFWDAGLIRPGFEDISHLRRYDHHEFAALLKAQDKYIYPDHPRENMTPDEIRALWNRMMNNGLPTST